MLPLAHKTVRLKKKKSGLCEAVTWVVIWDPALGNLVNDPSAFRWDPTGGIWYFLWGHRGEQEWKKKKSHRFNAIPDKVSAIKEVTEGWVLGPAGITVVVLLWVSSTQSYFP